MERTFFTLEQELLKPVYEIYPWTPDMSLGRRARGRHDARKSVVLSGRSENADRDSMLAKLIEKYAEGDMRLLKILQRPDLDR